MVTDTAQSSGFDYGPLRDKWYRQGWYSTRTCIDALRDGAARHGESPVVFITEQTETTCRVADIHGQALAVAAGLQRLGVAPGDAVAVQLTNRVECAIAYQAVLLCGAVLVPIIHIYGPHEVGFILAESAAKVLITAATLRSTSNLDRLDDYARIATLSHTVLVGAESWQGYLGWSTLTAPSADYAAPSPSPSADDVCLLLYTSGTTSAPKGVRHSHNSLLAEQATVADLIAGRPGDVQLVSFPPGHIAGVGSLLRPLMSGSRAVFVDSWDPARAADVIARYRVTSTAGTPFHLEGLLALGDTAGKLASLREFLVGAATVTDEQGRRAAAAGITTYRCYGLTEHPTVTGGHPEDPDTARLGTDGTPMRGSSVRILGPHAIPVPPGQAGEVVVQGPDQFIGYHDPVLNEVAFTADGWFRTGDLGHLDADGRLTITDRIKDVIIRAGETISSGQVEDVLNAHSAVREGAVVAAPDPRYGDVVAAVVVLQPGACLDLDEVRRHFAASGLAKQKTPERLVIVDALPRTSLGKVRKADLRATHFGR